MRNYSPFFFISLGLGAFFSQWPFLSLLIFRVFFHPFFSAASLLDILNFVFFAHKVRFEVKIVMLHYLTFWQCSLFGIIMQMSLAFCQSPLVLIYENDPMQWSTCAILSLTSLRTIQCCSPIKPIDLQITGNFSPMRHKSS